MSERLEGYSGWQTIFGIGLFLLLVGFGVLFNLSLAETAANIYVGLLSVIIAIAGLSTIGVAFFTPEKSGWGRIGSVIIGLIYLAIACAIWKNPAITTEYITAILATLFIFAGIAKFAVAFANRRAMGHWGIAAITGILTFFFGVFLWAHWPTISVTFVGVYVALEVITAGLVMVVSGLALRQ